MLPLDRRDRQARTCFPETEVSGTLFFLGAAIASLGLVSSAVGELHSRHGVRSRALCCPLRHEFSPDLSPEAV